MIDLALTFPPDLAARLRHHAKRRAAKQRDRRVGAWLTHAEAIVQEAVNACLDRLDREVKP